MKPVTAAAAVSVTLVAAALWSRAEQPPPRARAAPVERGAVAASVDRALLFLARQQQRDGLFADGQQRYALTALATLAFLAAGQPDGDGRYGGVVAAAADRLAADVPDDGYIGRVDGSRMYGQAMVCIALAELAGNTTDDARRQRLLASLRRAIAVVVSAQGVPKDARHAGGWRYEPTSTDSDLSLSGWCAQALRAARGVGVDVPEQAILRAKAYVLQCRDGSGGFAYQPGGAATRASNGAGALTLLLLSTPASPAPPEIAPALEQLVSKPVRFEDRFAYYALHNVVAAAHHAGPGVSAGVSGWAVPLLLSLQQPDGGFPASRSNEEPGRTYATALATLALCIPTSPLPSHQR